LYDQDFEVEMDLLLPILEKNPFKSQTLDCIRMPGESDSVLADESTETQYSVNWARLQPPGPLSLFLWSTNAIYRAGTETLRRNMLNEKIIELQARVQNGEIPSSRKFTKAKLSDALGMNIENASEENFECLEKAISTLGGVQWIRIHENEKKITCIPDDLRLWTNDKPILWTRERYRSAGEVPSGFSLKNLAKWVGDREADGFIFEYPHAEGTLETLKAQWNALGRGLPKLGPDRTKPLKEDYAKALGRALVYKFLGEAAQAPTSG
jgi:hypothetical protein